MSWRRIFAVVFANIRRNRRTFVLSSVGLIVGVATLTFFISLGMGIQGGVLNEIYPVNQIEIEPKTVGVVGLREQVVSTDHRGKELVERFGKLPHVTHVFPKLRSKFQARLWGGKSLLGYSARAEAFFDGLPAALLRGELQLTERVADKRARRARRGDAPMPCKVDEECPLGQQCGDAGRCGDIEYWQRFTDRGLPLPCDGAPGVSDHCPPGQACSGGLCETLCQGAEGICGDGQRCVAPATCGSGECPAICAPGCKIDGDCGLGNLCDGGACRALACKLDRPDRQFSERPGDLRGRLTTRCANGVDPVDPACEPMGCPDQTYCAPRSVAVAQGFCEAPIPVVLSPVLIELFNSSAASSLGMRAIDGTDAMLGFQFRLHMGDSYFSADLPKDKQVTKRAEIVGFSTKALELGVTMPLSYVRAFNARYKGTEAAENFDTFILETQGNEDVSRLIAEVDKWGFSLARRSQDAQKAADLLFILTLVFTFISAVIMFVAAVNIMHTFLTLVTERRYEIGIMRACGATRRDIRALFLGEATLLGLFGGVLGNLLSWGLSRGVNLAAAELLQGVPFKPDEFFVYDWRVVVGGIVFAWLFCLAGALLPAGRAARLDPARVLTS